MKITILSVVPEMLSSLQASPIVQHAMQKGILELEIVDIKEYADGSFRHIDDSPWQEGFIDLFHAVYENKPFIMNVYHCVSMEQVEKYLKPLTDQLLLDVLNELSKDMVIREEDKQFIAKIYSYMFVGVMLDWIRNDMKEEPKTLVSRFGKAIQNDFINALKRFRMDTEYTDQ